MKYAPYGYCSGGSEITMATGMGSIYGLWTMVMGHLGWSCRISQSVTRNSLKLFLEESKQILYFRENWLIKSGYNIIDM